MRARESRSIGAVEEKRASSSATRLLVSFRDKPGRSSKKEFKLFIFG